MTHTKWKMFERIVAAIHGAEQNGAKVQWNEVISGRQFDVTVRFKQGLYEYLTVIECKDYQNPVPAEKVDALVTKFRDVGADKAIMIASSGFQKGAIEVAKKHHIQLFSLKNLSEIEEKNVIDALTPVVSVYNFRFQVVGRKQELAIPEEPAILRLFLRNQRILGPDIDTFPEKLLDAVSDEMRRLATAEPQTYVIPFPRGTVAIHPNLGTRHPVASFSVVYQLITANNLMTTAGLGVNRYLDDSILQLQDEITSQRFLVDSSQLKLGVDTTLQPGKYYYNPHLKFSYYCLAVKDDKADMALIESYQNGKLFQCVAKGGPKEWWGQFVEVTDNRELERLKKLKADYERNVGGL